MLRDLDKMLRKAVLIVGGAVVLYKIIESARDEQQEVEEEFQEKEFDDIW